MPADVRRILHSICVIPSAEQYLIDVSDASDGYRGPPTTDIDYTIKSVERTALSRFIYQSVMSYVTLILCGYRSIQHADQYPLPVLSD